MDSAILYIAIIPHSQGESGSRRGASGRQRIGHCRGGFPGRYSMIRLSFHFFLVFLGLRLGGERERRGLTRFGVYI